MTFARGSRISGPPRWRQVLKKARNLPIGATHQQQRRRELLQPHHVARFRQLVGMCDEEPVATEDVLPLQLEESRIAVTARRNRRQRRKALRVVLAGLFGCYAIADLSILGIRSRSES